MPDVNWLGKSVVSFDPDKNQITLNDGAICQYDYLVVNPGNKLRFDLVKGA